MYTHGIPPQTLQTLKMKLSLTSTTTEVRKNKTKQSKHKQIRENHIPMNIYPGYSPLGKVPGTR